MNKIRAFKNFVDMTYDEIAELFAELDISIGRSTIANKSRVDTKSMEFLSDDDYTKFVLGLAESESPKVIQLVQRMRDTNEFIAKLVMDIDGGVDTTGLLGTADDLDVTDSEEVDDIDLDDLDNDDNSDDLDEDNDSEDFDIDDNSDDLDEDDDSEDFDIDDEDLDLDEDDDSEEDDDDIDLDDEDLDLDEDDDSEEHDDDIDEEDEELDLDDFDVDALVSGQKSKPKGSGKVIESDPEDPWSDVGDLRDVNEANPSSAGDEFEDGAFDEDDFDVDIDEV